MKELRRKFIAILLTITLIASALIIPEYNVQAESQSKLMVTVGEAPLKTDAAKNADIITKLPSGTLVYVTGTVLNEKGNTWYEVKYFDQTAYCYSENLQPHQHNYQYQALEGSDNLICECGAVQSSGVEQEDLVLTSSVLIYAGLATLAAVLYTQRDAIADAGTGLVYGAGDLADAVGEYGVRLSDKEGLVVPIRINYAGIAVAVTLEEFKNNMKLDQSDKDSGKIYCPAMIILGANGGDSLLVRIKGASMTLDEACDYVDVTLSTFGSFGKFSDFSGDVKFCNIYTPEQSDAINLCQKIVACNKNSINAFGTSNLINGAGQAEKNSESRISGTYMHYHLHNTFVKDHKACPHIFFGDKLSSILSSTIQM